MLCYLFLGEKCKTVLVQKYAQSAAINFKLINIGKIPAKKHTTKKNNLLLCFTSNKYQNIC